MRSRSRRFLFVTVFPTIYNDSTQHETVRNNYAHSFLFLITVVARAPSSFRKLRVGRGHVARDAVGPISSVGFRGRIFFLAETFVPGDRRRTIRRGITLCFFLIFFYYHSRAPPKRKTSRRTPLFRVSSCFCFVFCMFLISSRATRMGNGTRSTRVRFFRGKPATGSVPVRRRTVFASSIRRLSFASRRPRGVFYAVGGGGFSDRPLGPKTRIKNKRSSLALVVAFVCS